MPWFVPQLNKSNIRTTMVRRSTRSSSHRACMSEEEAASIVKDPGPQSSVRPRRKRGLNVHKKGPTPEYVVKNDASERTSRPEKKPRLALVEIVNGQSNKVSTQQFEIRRRSVPCESLMVLILIPALIVSIKKCHRDRNRECTRTTPHPRSNFRVTL